MADAGGAPDWLTGKFPQPLVDAAAFEVQRRESAYPPAIAEGRMGEADAQTDYVSWVAIHEWIATGRSAWIDWPAMEAAAAKALATVDAKIAARAKDTQAEDRELQRRRACLFAIHHAVQRMGGWIAQTNRQLRARRAPEGVAA